MGTSPQMLATDATAGSVQDGDWGEGDEWKCSSRSFGRKYVGGSRIELNLA